MTQGPSASRGSARRVEVLEVYPRGEYVAAWRAATMAGVEVPTFDAGYHAGVRILERAGYLPIDTERVARAVERVTAIAREHLEALERERAIEAGRVIDLAAWRVAHASDPPRMLRGSRDRRSVGRSVSP